MVERIKSQQEVLELARKNGLTLQESSLQFNESGLDFQLCCQQTMLENAGFCVFLDGRMFCHHSIEEKQ